ncbi:MAG: hypothetical protein IJU00_12400 [Selenomonas sp.]|nr:hypothetical protein [Selenomonas sp.]
MSPLRQEAISMVTAMPEMGLAALVQYIREYQSKFSENKDEVTVKIKEHDPFLMALGDDRLVTHTGIDVEAYLKELREDDRM